VSKGEALQYLKTEYLKTSKDGWNQAAQKYELVGGRMIHLRSVADRNGTFEGMCIACYAENRISF
jgi:hypothetical protein